jgi:hypothetical protein
MRETEVNIEFRPKRPSVVGEKMSEFVILGSTYMMPASSLKLIEDTIVRVDYDGYGENRIWKRHKQQALTVEKVSFAQAVAMCVNEKLEAANGN